MSYEGAVKFLVAMIIMMNPLSSLSIFLDLTKPFSATKRKKTVIQCSIAITIIMFASIWFGNQILDLLGITINSFRVAGGIILLLTGLAMLQSKESPINHTPEDDLAATDREDISIVPLALPIIIGPGAISTLIIASTDYPNLVHKLSLSVLCLLLSLGMFIMLYSAKLVVKYVGESIIKVITRIMGMLIMAIAVGMMTKGLTGLL